MRTILNLIWLVLSGVWMAIGYVVAGVLLCVTIIGIPFGIQAFKLAGYALWPFGRALVPTGRRAGLSAIANVLWFVLAGWWLALGHLFTGILLCLTIIGLPLGVASFKMAGAALVPFGKEIVPLRVTRQPAAGHRASSTTARSRRPRERSAVGFDSSTGFPDGSSTTIWSPPTLCTTSSVRRCAPAARSRSSSAARSVTSSEMRFQPPGCRPRPVREHLAPAALPARRAQQQAEVAAREHRERGRRVELDREPEPVAVEADRRVDDVPHVHARHRVTSPLAATDPRARCRPSSRRSAGDGHGFGAGAALLRRRPAAGAVVAGGRRRRP